MVEAKLSEDHLAQEAMRQYYDESDYFERELEKFRDRTSSFQRYRIAKVLRLYTPGPADRVLDLACGWGTFTFSMAPLCQEVVGIDYSSKAIEGCRRLQKRGDFNTCSFRCAPVDQTGEPSDSFDAVICADGVEHLYREPFEGLLKETRRILKPGGKLVIWTPHRGHLFEILKAHHWILKQDPSHVDFKSMKQILSSLKAHGFIIRVARYEASHLPLFCILERALGGFLPILRRRIAVLAEKSGT